ncbi:dihydrofolate reductase [Leucobacter sp. UT-8R-CII-1-4]|uniref:dihydrofolate reductase n=1 Tax=Leucobacter sp. UT-8R-CII-1-4 TaxID=3040075 RepID=UPI0024A86EBF|nr:dihydrofolate reductase [Leucobacter sp. UT-8R-CII-1-4]MDI6022955.1 dihydrofolate reductase [Leucobacter sp. UT-8R-CII-1-4]
MEIVLVWAEANGHAIGKDGVMPWHLPEDLAHFKKATLGGPVIMGRRTWQSLPERFRPLPGRENIVVSRDAAFVAEGATLVGSLEAALGRAAGEARVSIIGGGQIYREAMSFATELVVTRIDTGVDGADTFAPEIGAEWQCVDAGEPLTAANGLGYRFERYRRRA